MEKIKPQGPHSFKTVAKMMMIRNSARRRVPLFMGLLYPIGFNRRRSEVLQIISEIMGFKMDPIKPNSKSPPHPYMTLQFFSNRKSIQLLVIQYSSKYQEIKPTKRPPVCAATSKVPWYSLFQDALTRCGNFIANTTEGRLSGYQSKSRSKRSFIGFSGIPYAKPPVGNLRFQDPQPPEPWEGIRKAQFFGNMCLQSLHNIRFVNSAVVGSEDCLYLSVYTHSLKPETLNPVLVYIHGGVFEFGGGEFEGRPGNFMDHDVVVVTMNYRLGPLGFLSMEDEILPGNLGLKDQTMALRWVQRNIKNFGGDPKKVTIMGESAGGASIYLHMISPMSKGLIQGGISQSGAALSPWGYLKPGVARARAIKVAKSMKCPVDSTKAMVDCLKQSDGREIMRQFKLFPMNQMELKPVFAPVMDPASKNPFLPKDPNKVKPNHVSWMTGCTLMEGVIKSAYFTKFPNDYQEMDRNFINMSKVILFKDNEFVPNDVINRIRRYYFGNETISKEMVYNITDLFSDSWFIWPMIRSLSMHKGPKYVYYDTYQGERSLQDIYGIHRLVNGTAHADEFLYLWSTYIPMDVTEEDQKFSKLLVKLWVNFATYGTPTPKGFEFQWPQWNKASQKYLKFSNQGVSVEEKLLPERMAFWSSVMNNVK
ncbi:venom carboxylesterase-6-like [Rhodnius prolixus]|uniref:venom carboxylesterase-6-like n=1 Tax=Rhodnius prolixus TaxID=13249 RepID=UPI003D189545